MIERDMHSPDPLAKMIDEMGDDYIEILDPRGTTVAVILPIEMYDDLMRYFDLSEAKRLNTRPEVDYLVDTADPNEI